MGFSLLGSVAQELPESVPEYFVDLNLDQMIEEFDAKASYYHLLETEGEVYERQELIRELSQENAENCMKNFYNHIEKAKEYEVNANKGERSSGKSHWHLLAAYTFYRTVDETVEFWENEQPKSNGWKRFLNACQTIICDGTYKKRHDLAIEAYEGLAQLRFGLRIEGDNVAVLQAQEEDYIGNLHKRFPEQIPDAPELSALLPGNEEIKLEQKIFAILKKNNPQYFQWMDQFDKECPDFFDPQIMSWQRELPFYLSYLKLKRHMEYYGHSFCYPVFKQEMKIDGGYDLALAIKNQEAGKPTVSNDYFLDEKERFLVVTGPNQGGKTTFARSIGQLVYFSLLGFPVPAENAELPFFSGLITHFSVEESMETGRGKLKEELIRLADMVNQDAKNQFVIINELFTSAATYDALHMGRRVISHFLEQDCHGVYVTHIEELAEENDRIVSMVAALAEGSSSERSYKVTRKAAEGKGYVDSIVERYGLSYDEIIRRVRHV